MADLASICLGDGQTEADEAVLLFLLHKALKSHRAYIMFANILFGFTFFRSRSSDHAIRSG